MVYPSYRHPSQEGKHPLIRQVDLSRDDTSTCFDFVAMKLVSVNCSSTVHRICPRLEGDVDPRAAIVEVLIPGAGFVNGQWISLDLFG